MSKMQFEFTVEEANLILESLGQMPFQRVYQLVQNVQEQAQRAVQKAQRVEEKAKPEAEAAE